MEQPITFPLYDVLEKTFSKSLIQDLEAYYFPEVKDFKKWMCFSDYCFDDPNKPNNVMTFSLMPYIDDIGELSDFIRTVAQKDIKNTRKVNNAYINFLEKYPLINFAFILNHKKKILGQSANSVVEFLKASFNRIKQHYQVWIESQPEKTDHYRSIIKKLDKTIRQVEQQKKIKQVAEMFLVTYIGAFVSSLIVKKTQLEIFGWFSDRDAIHEVSDQLSANLFEYFLFNFSDAHNYQYVTASATSLDKPFYDQLLKIPDYITGTLADFNFGEGTISKDKFDTVLTDYMADNARNNFVFQITPSSTDINCSRTTFHKKVKMF